VERKLTIVGVAGMVVFLAFSAWFDLSGQRHDTASVQPSVAPTASGSPGGTATPGPGNSVVERNRNERRGPSWSPADVIGKDGQPLTIGKVVPGAFGPVKAGMGIQEAIGTGFIEPDPNRGEACEGSFWKWKGQLASGLDIIVGDDKKVSSLGMSKDGLETVEGISVGNSYGTLKKTYGDRLQGPERMDYGQAGSFLRDGDKWIGFGMDNRPGQLDDDSRIAFIEVTQGHRPGLLRDGC
jgi:hypothetical protein